MQKTSGLEDIMGISRCLKELDITEGKDMCIESGYGSIDGTDIDIEKEYLRNSVSSNPSNSLHSSYMNSLGLYPSTADMSMPHQHNNRYDMFTGSCDSSPPGILPRSFSSTFYDNSSYCDFRNISHGHPQCHLPRPATAGSISDLLRLERMEGALHDVIRKSSSAMISSLNTGYLPFDESLSTSDHMQNCETSRIAADFRCSSPLLFGNISHSNEDLGLSNNRRLNMFLDDASPTTGPFDDSPPPPQHASDFANRHLSSRNMEQTQPAYNRTQSVSNQNCFYSKGHNRILSGMNDYNMNSTMPTVDSFARHINTGNQYGTAMPLMSQAATNRSSPLRLRRSEADYRREEIMALWPHNCSDNNHNNSSTTTITNFNHGGIHHHQNNHASQAASNSNQSNNNNNNNRPLRSQRVDIRIVYAMMYRALANGIAGTRREVCVFCRNNGEHELIYTSHSLKDSRNRVTCPILRAYQCPICQSSGDRAHTIKYCPYNNDSSITQDTPLEKLFRYVSQPAIINDASMFLGDHQASAGTSSASSSCNSSPMSISGNSPCSASNIGEHQSHLHFNMIPNNSHNNSAIDCCDSTANNNNSISSSPSDYHLNRMINSQSTPLVDNGRVFHHS